MSLSVFSKSLRDLRWQAFWYGVGLGLMAAMVVYIYPSYKDQLARFELPESLKALVGGADYGSPVGFISAEFFSWAPVLLVVFGIMAGTSALGGEEAAGTLDLLLAQPLSRSRLVLEKMAAILISSIVITLIIYGGWLLSVPFVDIELSYWRLFLATLSLVPLILVFAALSIWCAAAMPDRRLATGVVTGIAVLSYFVNYLAVLVDLLKPLRYGSVFYYYDGSSILSGHANLLKLSLLLLLTVVFAVLAIATFEQRDIGVRDGITLPRFRRARREAG